jgi:hypothetical protein
VQSKDCSSTGHVQRINTDGSVTCSADGGGSVTVNSPFVPMAWVQGVGGTEATTVNPNAPFFQRFRVTAGGTFNSALVSIATAVASSHLMVGIYSSPCGTGATLLGQATVTSSATGVKSGSFSSALGLPPGDYWLALASDSSGVAVQSTVTQSPIQNLLNGAAMPVLALSNQSTSGTTTLPANCGTLNAYSMDVLGTILLMP